MSPAATVTQEPGAIGRRQTSLVQPLDTTTWAVCGGILPSDQSLLGPGNSEVVCAPGAFCAVSSTYMDCVPYTGGRIRTTCLDKSATCVGFACPTDAIICSIGSTDCLTWNYASSFTGYGCGNTRLSINAIPLSLTEYTPTPSSTSTDGAGITSTASSLASSPTSISVLQTTSSTNQVVGSSILSTAPSSPPSSAPSSSPSSSSTEEKIGIGIGVSFGALLIITIILTIIFRKKLNTRLKLFRPKNSDSPHPNHKVELPNSMTGMQQAPAELIAPQTTQINHWQPYPAQHQVPYELGDPHEIAHELLA